MNQKRDLQSRCAMVIKIEKERERGDNKPLHINVFCSMTKRPCKCNLDAQYGES